ncbi:hypothetical protein M758_5G113800 [Ceratodon purpureus]|nr:hypothetical protein M758_5G113800 [Ceratodon purpureus]
MILNAITTIIIYSLTWLICVWTPECSTDPAHAWIINSDTWTDLFLMNFNISIRNPSSS